MAAGRSPSVPSSSAPSTSGLTGFSRPNRSAGCPPTTERCVTYVVGLKCYLCLGCTREGGDGTTTRSATGDDRAAAGAESGSLLELRRDPLGGVPQPAPADATGRGRPVHAGDPPLPDAVVGSHTAAAPDGRQQVIGQ